MVYAPHMAAVRIAARAATATPDGAFLVGAVAIERTHGAIVIVAISIKAAPAVGCFVFMVTGGEREYTQQQS